MRYAPQHLGTERQKRAAQEGQREDVDGGFHAAGQKAVERQQVPGGMGNSHQNAREARLMVVSVTKASALHFIVLHTSLDSKLEIGHDEDEVDVW